MGVGERRVMGGEYAGKNISMGNYSPRRKTVERLDTAILPGVADLHRESVTSQNMQGSTHGIGRSSTQQTIQTKSSSNCFTFTESSAQYGNQGAGEALDVTILPGGTAIPETVTGQGTRVITHKVQSPTQQATQGSNFEIGKSTSSVSSSESASRYKIDNRSEVLDVTVLPGGGSVRGSATGPSALEAKQEFRSTQQITEKSAELDIGKSSRGITLSKSSGHYGAQSGREVIDVTILPGTEASQQGMSTEEGIKTETTREPSGGYEQTSTQQTTQASIQRSTLVSAQKTVEESDRSVDIVASSEEHGEKRWEGRLGLAQDHLQGSEDVQASTRENIQGSKQQFAHQDSYQILSQSIPQQCPPQSLGIQLSSAAFTESERDVAATEPISLGELIKDAVVKLAEDTVENYAGGSEREVTGTRVPDGEQEGVIGASEENSLSKVINEQWQRHRRLTC